MTPGSGRSAELAHPAAGRDDRGDRLIEAVDRKAVDDLPVEQHGDQSGSTAGVGSWPGLRPAQPLPQCEGPVVVTAAPAEPVAGAVDRQRRNQYGPCKCPFEHRQVGLPQRMR